MNILGKIIRVGCLCMAVLIVALLLVSLLIWFIVGGAYPFNSDAIVPMLIGAWVCLIAYILITMP